MTFYATLGSRALILWPIALVIIVRHYSVARLAVRTVLIASVVVLVSSSVYLGFRQATYRSSPVVALREGVGNVDDVRPLLNDNTVFDGVLQAVTIFGRSAPFENGMGAVDALHSFVPLDPGRPEGGDIQFRRLVWGERFQGGRPLSIVGEFYRERGLWGVAFGAFLLALVVARSRD